VCLSTPFQYPIVPLFSLMVGSGVSPISTTLTPPLHSSRTRYLPKFGYQAVCNRPFGQVLPILVYFLTHPQFFPKDVPFTLHSKIWPLSVAAGHIFSHDKLVQCNEVYLCRRSAHLLQLNEIRQFRGKFEPPSINNSLCDVFCPSTLLIQSSCVHT